MTLAFDQTETYTRTYRIQVLDEDDEFVRASPRMWIDAAVAIGEHLSEDDREEIARKLLTGASDVDWSAAREIVQQVRSTLFEGETIDEGLARAKELIQSASGDGEPEAAARALLESLSDEARARVCMPHVDWQTVREGDTIRDVRDAISAADYDPDTTTAAECIQHLRRDCDRLRKRVKELEELRQMDDRSMSRAVSEISDRHAECDGLQARAEQAEKERDEARWRAERAEKSMVDLLAHTNNVTGNYWAQDSDPIVTGRTLQGRFEAVYNRATRAERIEVALRDRVQEQLEAEKQQRMRAERAESAVEAIRPIWNALVRYIEEHGRTRVANELFAAMEAHGTEINEALDAYDAATVSDSPPDRVGVDQEQSDPSLSFGMEANPVQGTVGTHDTVTVGKDRPPRGAARNRMDAFEEERAAWRRRVEELETEARDLRRGLADHIEGCVEAIEGAGLSREVARFGALENVAAAARRWLELWKHEGEPGQPEDMTRGEQWPAVEEELVNALDELQKVEGAASAGKDGDADDGRRYARDRKDPSQAAPPPARVVGGGTWRVGRKNPLNVYEGTHGDERDRSICQAHTPEDARRIVDAVNKAKDRPVVVRNPDGRWIAYWPPWVVANGWQPYDQPGPAYVPLGFDRMDRINLFNGACVLVAKDLDPHGKRPAKERPDPGTEHLVDGEFQSDKYPTCPRGKVPLSTKDPMAQDLLWAYAQRRRSVDASFADDLERALRLKGYEADTDTGNPFGGVQDVRHDVDEGNDAEKLSSGDTVAFEVRGCERIGTVVSVDPQRDVVAVEVATGEQYTRSLVEVHKYQGAPPARDVGQGLWRVGHGDDREVYEGDHGNDKYDEWVCKARVPQVAQRIVDAVNHSGWRPTCDTCGVMLSEPGAIELYDGNGLAMLIGPPSTGGTVHVEVLRGESGLRSKRHKCMRCFQSGSREEQEGRGARLVEGGVPNTVDDSAEVIARDALETGKYCAINNRSALRKVKERQKLAARINHFVAASTAAELRRMADRTGDHTTRYEARVFARMCRDRADEIEGNTDRG